MSIAQIASVLGHSLGVPLFPRFECAVKLSISYPRTVENVPPELQLHKWLLHPRTGKFDSELIMMMMMMFMTMMTTKTKVIMTMMVMMMLS